MNQIKELICKKIESQELHSLDDIVDLININKEIKTYAIKEWNACNNELYQRYLAEQYLSNNDDESITDARISKYFDISIKSANKIKEIALLIQDEEILKLDNDENSLIRLRMLVEPFIYDSSLDGGRRNLLKKELDNVCLYGYQNRILLAYDIANLIKGYNHFYSIKGDITSSLIAYHLGIHNVDCYKRKIDYHFCYGTDFDKYFSLDFRVSDLIINDVIKSIKDYLFLDGNSLYFLNQNKWIYNSLVFNPNNVSVNKQKSVDKEGKDCFGISYDEYNRHKKMLININILKFTPVSFIDRMSKIYPLDNIINDDTYPVNELVANGANFPFRVFGNNTIRKTFDDFGELTFENLVKSICLTKSCKSGGNLLLKNSSINTVDDAFKFLMKEFDYTKSLSIIKDHFAHKNIDKYNLDNEKYSELLGSTYLPSESNGLIDADLCLKECFYIVNYPDESVKTFLEMQCFGNKQLKNGVFVFSSKLKIFEDLFTELMHEYHSKFVYRYIGIFFYINNELRFYRKRLYINEKKDFMDVKKSHFDLFASYKMEKEFEYSMFPRGRVLYNVKNNLFIVYADKTLLKDESKKNEIINAFNLPKINCVFKSDEHYKTLRY